MLSFSFPVNGMANTSSGTEMRPIPPLKTYIGDAVASDIPGSAPLRIKDQTIKWFGLLAKAGPKAYGYTMRQRLELKEVSLEPSCDDPENMSVKIINELDVVPGTSSFD